MPSHPRRAVIYLPGLLSQMSGDAGGAFARRLASALDRTDPVGSHAYGISAAKTVTVGDLATSRFTVERTTEEGTDELVDIFEFPYPATLFNRFNRVNPLRQAIRIIALVVAKLPRIVFFRRNRLGKGPGERMQIAYGALLLLLLALYVPIFLSTALVALTQALGLADTPVILTSGLPEVLRQPAAFAGGLAEAAWPWVEFVVLGAAGLGIVTRVDVKELWYRSTQYVVPAMEYLQDGTHAGSIMGRLADLLEEIVEDTEREYEHVELWGFSFGSVLALDILFPPSGHYASDRLKLVDRLVTIGLPVAFVNIFYPRYFEGRGRIATASRFPWTNVFNPRDLLGTRFGGEGGEPTGKERVGQDERTPDMEIEYSPGGGVDAVAGLGGFAAHRQYWDRRDIGGDSNSVDVLAARLGLAQAWAPDPDASDRDGA